MLSPYAESWEIIELLSRTSRKNWSSWNGWKEESWWKKSTILLDNLKRMAIFALFSYELGRQVKASIFSLKGMLAFFYCPIPRGYYNKDGCSLNFLTISMQNENKPTSCDSRHWGGGYQTCPGASLQASTFRQGWESPQPLQTLLG